MTRRADYGLLDSFSEHRQLLHVRPQPRPQVDIEVVCLLDDRDSVVLALGDAIPPEFVGRLSIWHLRKKSKEITYLRFSEHESSG